MIIDWQHFTPWTSLAGGVLIGIAAAAYLLLNGRIAGISSILGAVVGFRKDEATLWRVLFLAGLILAPSAWLLAGALPEAGIAADYPQLVAAGLLVGLGTRYGSGCTSGHGVCGLSSLSLRSLVATLCFMGTGFATVYVVRHLVQAGA
ncbi:MAG: YeeE/YedE family protein [Betaproteobacteria bacterium]|nr:YeeE/YedE family protein [Betaproteobacteria bacterium]